MKPTRALLLCAALLVPVLGGCSRSEPEATPTENLDARATDTPPPTPEPATSPSPPTPPVAAPSDANATDVIEPEPATPPDEQMLDDASATGMTARATRNAPDEAPANDEIEQK